jgi:flagellar biosynthesis protein FlhF
VPLHPVESASELGPATAAAAPGELVIVDTAGINPYSAEDRRELSGLIEASAADPVLVLPAGGDAVDTLELAGCFREHGCQRIVVTRLDVTRRLGSVIATADALRLGFAEAGVSASIAEGLTPFNPVLLARLLLAAAVRPRRALLEKTR